jgi:hypothetical protein
MALSLAVNERGRGRGVLTKGTWIEHTREQIENVKDN